jgi:NodT family efflux transporter outer membrane factor (OMF) lipoprotein
MRPFKSPTLCLGLLAAILLLPGCVAGPDYQRPDVAVPGHYKETPDRKAEDARSRRLIAAKWWELFGDPLLNRLESQVGANFTLAQAEAQYQQSLAVIQNARSVWFPRVTANAAYNRFVSPQGAARIIPGVRETYTTALTAVWELDLWGRIRRQVESAEAQAEASADTVDALRLSLQAQLAQTYFALRTLDAQKEVVEANVAAFRRTLELTRNRYEAGIVGKADVMQAETQLTFTEAQSADLDVQRAQLEHAIAVLIGKPPAEVTLPRSAELVPLPKLPDALPSTLLQRRPDIAAAEQQIVAANANIGAARAAFFPNVTINSATGFQSSTIERLYTSAAHYYSLGPAAAALPLFDAGARNATLRQAYAAHKAAEAAYRQAVLTGFQEVEDGFSNLRALETEAKALELSVKSGEEAVRLTTNQYKAGTASFQAILTAQTASLVNQRTAIGVRGQQLEAAVGLVRALGGGWDPAAAPERKPSEEIDWRMYMPWPVDG